MSFTTKQYKNVIEGTLATIRELWMKGVPVETPVFTFYTYQKQHILIQKRRKKRKYPHYNIIFDVERIPLSTQRGHANKIKMFRMNKRQVRALVATIIREETVI